MKKVIFVSQVSYFEPRFQTHRQAEPHLSGRCILTVVPCNPCFLSALGLDYGATIADSCAAAVLALVLGGGGAAAVVVVAAATVAAAASL